MSEGFDAYREIFTVVENNLQLKILPKIKINMRSASANISNLIDILVRKSFIKEDLYKYDDAIISKFELPEEKAFETTKKSEDLYIRLKALSGALNFLADSTPNTIEEMNDLYLENIIKCTEYFAFHNLSSASNVNTRTIKEITDKAQGSGDEIFKRVMSDNLKLLIDSFHMIKNTVEEINKILKSLYKAQIRFEVMPDIPSTQFTEELFKSNMQKYLDNLNLYLASNCPGVSYKSKWITEALNDYYTIDEVEMLSKMQKDLIGETENKTANDKRTLSPRERLIILIFDIAGTKKILQDIYYDLDHNVKLTKSVELSFMEKFVRTLKIMFNIQDDSDFYHIEYINPSTKRVQKDIIKIDEFSLSIKKKIQTFDEIVKPNSDANYKIKNGTNESLLKFLDTTYFNLVLLKERIVSINTEVRSKAPATIKKRFRDLTNNAQQLETILSNIGALRRKFIIEQEQFSKHK